MENNFYAKSFIFNNFLLSENVMSFIEIIFAFLVLILFFPLMISISLAIKLFMGGEVFYTQTRVGKNGVHFKIIKFRSMIENAEAESGPRLSCLNDQRVTKLGKFLRASHLDELPQLINVIRGEMSFVGPRPERPEFVEIFEKEIAFYTKRNKVKPGITGPAQICLPYDAPASEKLHYDVFYIENKKSLLFNLIIYYRTALKMLTFFRN